MLDIRHVKTDGTFNFDCAALQGGSVLLLYICGIVVPYIDCNSLQCKK